jgi:hypothetical protein
MELNLPIFPQLAQCKNLLIAGMGGGYDIFCGLPIYFELRWRGQKAHLANFSFADIINYRHGERLSDTLIGVDGSEPGLAVSLPEQPLARWLGQHTGEPVKLWCFHKTGTAPLLENYRLLLERLQIDGILLIDGGVDSLMRGDEDGVGTLVEDAISLHVVNDLPQIPTRLLACLGFGAERDVAHAHVFENIAALTAAGGFLGACALTPQMPVYKAYEEAVLHV